MSNARTSTLRLPFGDVRGEERNQRSHTKRAGTRLSAWWLLLAGALLLWNLAYAPLWNPDEGRYASASREMAGDFRAPASLQTGANDWLVPHLNTFPRLNKPPLIYWAVGGTMRILGANEWSARLPSALAAVAVMLLVWRLGKRMFGNEAGVVGAFAWSTGALAFTLGRTCNTDMLLSCAMTLALFGIWTAVEGRDDGERHSKRSSALVLLCSSVGFGAALLAKGPVGVALPLLIGFAYLCLAKRWHLVPPKLCANALLLGFALGLPWFFAVERAHPGFLANFLLRENFGRLSGGEKYHAPTSPLFYVPVVLAGFLPWTAWLLTIFVPQPRAFFIDSADTQANEQRARRFLWLWAIVVVGVFSLSSTKLISYVLPAFPALALLVGASWKRFTDQTSASTLALSGTVLLGVAALIGAGIFANANRVMPRDEAWPALAPAMLSVVAMGVAPWLFARRGDWSRVALAQFLGAGAFCASLLPFANRLSPYEESSNIVRWAAPKMPANARFAVFSIFEPTAIFYLGRPITLVDFRNNSGLDEAALARSPLVLRTGSRSRKGPSAPQLLARLLNDSRPTFVLLRWKSGLLPTKTRHHVWARSNDFALIANRYPPPQRFDFVGPKRRRELIEDGRYVAFPGERVELPPSRNNSEAQRASR